MSLELHYHPLASFCHKALIALYEGGTPFERQIVDLGDETSRAAFQRIWPLAKMPILRDRARDRIVPEATIIIEYLDRFYPGGAPLVPADAERAWQARLWDRFHDLYVQEPMQKIVTDRLRPAGQSDRYGVEQAKLQLQQAYGLLERELAAKAWAIGEEFTLADCAAAPALFYADTVVPFADAQSVLRGYLDRLLARPSVARVLDEAQPYFELFPLERKPQLAPRRAGGQGR